MAPSVGIIADDLTSAADGGGPFVKKGFEVEVLRGVVLDEGARAGKVLAVDCESRSQPPLAAAAAVERAVRTLAAAPILYKTIDSTLRGHIVEEVNAAYEASGRDHIVIAPAFPDAGRTTVDGVQYIDGIPVSESVYAADPVHPTKTSQIAELLPAGVKNATILDAESQVDLNLQVASLKDHENILWVGSPGLAIALAEASAGAGQPSKRRPSAEHSLIVMGSANPVSRQQIECAEGAPFATCVAAIKKRDSDPVAVLDSVVRQALVALENPNIDALIATGGDTMQAMLDALGITSFDLLGEFEPGFPIGQTRLRDGRSLILGMKAGGFGQKDTLRSAAQSLFNNAIRVVHEKA